LGLIAVDASAVFAPDMIQLLKRLILACAAVGTFIIPVAVFRAGRFLLIYDLIVMLCHGKGLLPGFAAFAFQIAVTGFFTGGFLFLHQFKVMGMGQPVDGSSLGLAAFAVPGFFALFILCGFLYHIPFTPVVLVVFGIGIVGIIIRIFLTAVFTQTALEGMVFFKFANHSQHIATTAAFVPNLLTGGFRNRLTARTFCVKVMENTADAACIVIPFFIIFILVGTVAVFAFTGGALLIMLRLGVVPFVIEGMAFRRSFLFLDDLTDHTADTSGTGFCTGGCVTAGNLFPDMVFFCSTDLTGMDISLCIHIPSMVFGIADSSLTVPAILDMSTVLQVHICHILMDTVLNNATTVAHIDLRAVLASDCFHLVTDTEAAVNR
jgi:hypothetical protein